MLKQKPLLLLWLAIQASLLVLLQQAFTSWISATFAALLLLRLLTTWRAKETLSLKWVNVLAAVLTLLGLLLHLPWLAVPAALVLLMQPPPKHPHHQPLLLMHPPPQRPLHNHCR